MSLAVNAFSFDDGKAPDQVVCLSGATWSDYERVLRIRGDRAVPRIAFDSGLLELLCPSREHELTKSTIGRLVETWCEVNNVDFTATGSWTLKRRRTLSGVEPDQCYVFGETMKRRPDLAIEVVLNEEGIGKRELYRRLGVPELWEWRREEICVHVPGDTAGRRRRRSNVLPGIDLEELASFVDMFPTSKAMRAYRAALVAKRRA